MGREEGSQPGQLLPGCKTHLSSLALVYAQTKSKKKTWWPSTFFSIPSCAQPVADVACPSMSLLTPGRHCQSPHPACPLPDVHAAAKALKPSNKDFLFIPLVESKGSSSIIGISLVLFLYIPKWNGMVEIAQLFFDCIIASVEHISHQLHF